MASNGVKIAWGKARKIILRDGQMCRYCGIDLPLEKITFDHIIPVSSGGTACMDNLVCCCQKCNTEKGSLQNMKLLPPKRTSTQVNKMIVR